LSNLALPISPFLFFSLSKLAPLPILSIFTRYMTPAFEDLLKALKPLPGLGARSAEKIALHLLVEKPARLPKLINALQEAGRHIRRCGLCGNLAEHEKCNICSDHTRNQDSICVVEQVPDLVAFERSGTYRGLYHVLHGKLSPVNGIGPDELNLALLAKRCIDHPPYEIILALSNDIEGEATCHYIQQHTLAGSPAQISRIGFGIPSGSGVTYADPITLRSALKARTSYT
jgi:recombination protein RecR